MLERNDGAILRLDPQRKSSAWINPAEELTRSGYRMKNVRMATVDQLFARPLATPIALLREPGETRHRLPLPARLIQIHRNEQPRELVRLTGIHINVRAGSHEISRRRCRVDQEEA